MDSPHDSFADKIKSQPSCKDGSYCIYHPYMGTTTDKYRLGNDPHAAIEGESESARLHRQLIRQMTA